MQNVYFADQRILRRLAEARDDGEFVQLVGYGEEFFVEGSETGLHPVDLCVRVLPAVFEFIRHHDVVREIDCGEKKLVDLCAFFPRELLGGCVVGERRRLLLDVRDQIAVLLIKFFFCEVGGHCYLRPYFFDISLPNSVRNGCNFLSSSGSRSCMKSTNSDIAR